MRSTDDRPLHVLCVGETMAAVVPMDADRIVNATQFAMHAGGAESNVALHLCDQGLAVKWASRLGTDAVGDRVLCQLETSGLDVSLVIRDPEARTGLYLKEKGANGVSRTTYFRDDSAAARFSPRDVASFPLADCRWVHTSGITAALSDSSRAMVEALFAAARDVGTSISFDVNYRPQLWRDRHRAAEVLHAFAELADIVFVGLDEAQELWETDSAEGVATLFTRPSRIVVKDGATEAVEFGPGPVRTVSRVPAPPVEVVELVGAGDAFAGGFLAGLLLGEDSANRLRRGHALAGWTIGSWQDYRPSIVPRPTEGA